MKLLSPLLFGLVMAVGCSGSDSGPAPSDPNEPPDSTIDWNSIAAAPRVAYTRGTPVIVAEATVDQNGGTIAGTAGSPIDGVVLTIPAGAVTSATTFQLGYDNGTFANLSDGTNAGPVIVLESSGSHAFQQPLKFEYPSSDTVNPVAYYIDEDGTLDVLPPAQGLATPGRRTFLTWHASDFTWINHNPKLKPVFNGFHPEMDGFPFPNPDVRYVKGGRCWGMSDYAKWYRGAHGSGLHSQFQVPVPTVHKSESDTDRIGPKTAQDVLTTRAHLAVAQHGGKLVQQWPKEFVDAIKGALSTGPFGVMVGLGGPSGSHAVLAIGYSDNQVAIYDPNYPNKIKAIDYDLDSPNPTLKYKTYDVFATWGNGEQKRDEQYNLIHDDASSSFNGENETKIEITSHNDGDTVSNEDITLEGKVYSGQVRIRDLELHVLDPGSTTERAPQSFPMPATADKSFSFPITLKKGDSKIWFITRGFNIDKVSPIPNSSVRVPNKELFSLKYDKELNPMGSLVVKSDKTETAGDTRTVTNILYSTNVSFQTFDIGKMIEQSTFDFSKCTYADQNCTIVRAMSVNKVPFVDGTNYAVTIEYHSKTYSTIGGTEELIRYADGSGALSCQVAIVNIAIEPGSTKDNYRYRVYIAPGGNCSPSEVKTTGKYKDFDNWYDSSPEDVTLEMSTSLALDGANDPACATPPFILPAAIEGWAADPKSTQSWFVTGDLNCTDGSNTVVEKASATITLIP